MLIIDKNIYIFESMLFVLSRAATSKGEIQQILNLIFRIQCSDALPLNK